MKKSFKEIHGEVLLESSTFDESNKRKFEVQHLAATKTFSITDRASDRRDSKILKKLTKDIWEFRIRHEGLQYRLLAFWERDDDRRLMLTTHAFLKKTDKIPLKELRRAENIRSQYFNAKTQNS